MKQKILTLSLGVAAVLLVAQQANAQTTQNAPNCAPRQQVLNHLAERWGETRQSIGLGGNNAVVEMFASRDTGTWTIIVTLPNGVTCLVASGAAYESVTELLPDPTNQPA